MKLSKMTDFVAPFKMAHPVSTDGTASPVSGLLWNTLGYDQERPPGLPPARTGWTVGWGYGTVPGTAAT